MLVLDIDGTLINQAGKISDSDRAAVSQARAAGLIVCLCTGRSTQASAKILSELELPGAHIFFDGTLVYDPGENLEIYAQPIPPLLVAEMTDYALRSGLPLDLFSRTRYFVTEESWRTQLRKEFFGIEATITDLSTLYTKEKILKGGITVRTPAEKKLAQKFADHFANQLNLTWTVTPAFPEIQFINVVNPGTSKGRALEALCLHLGISLDQVCAIGDGSNDISLISRVGLGIAMRNSPAELISVARYVTVGVEDSGVSQAVSRFILNK